MKGYGVFETKLGTNYAVAVFHSSKAAASAKGDLFLNGNGICPGSSKRVTSGVGERGKETAKLFFIVLIEFVLLIRCGQETRVIPRLLQIRTHWLKSQKESLRLEEAGLHKDVSLIEMLRVRFSIKIHSG